ncbi:hypothetical protein EDB81DRAFT_810411 [Dactylonectria macrodidyma]|uniref:DUF7580 domain-containing protein n=1 Tax=Dactylonectria macrodidyma TaxID=307937 RepID=A0A9P9DW54_9HYPO|nr:hypothetical protein EDB81DRAFT_810411 [Dactylonectria macrodidyma]
MSGFEVAGIVLGSIPLVISGLEHYINGLGMLQNFRSYKRVLKSLILALQTEHVSIQNICEKLLVGIAPQTRIEEMIDDPFGDLWREEEILSKLRLRLWRSFKIFDERIRDMKEAIEELRSNLNIDPGGKLDLSPRLDYSYVEGELTGLQAEWTESMPVKKQIKRALFVLQKSNHEEILTRIRDGVSALQRVAIQDTELELDRKSRSQGRLNKLINEISSSIYHALKSTLTCKCSSLHDVGLRLAPPSRTITPADEDDEIIKELQFRIAISQMESTKPSSRQWNELRFQISEDQANEQTTQLSLKETSSAKKSVRFLTVSSATSTAIGSHPTQTSVMLQSAISSLSLSTDQSNTGPTQPRQIKDLCEAMRGMEKQKCGEQCGHIQDCITPKHHNYGVYVLESPGSGEEWTLVPLKGILQNPNLLYGERLRLAWVIACSALQMHGTPWISSVPKSDGIYLVQKYGAPQYRNVFILKHFPERGHGTSTSQSTKPSANPFLLSLGILLIELILGQSIENLQATRVPETGSGIPQHVLDYEVANSLLGRVMMAAGSRYCSAVERCLRCDIPGESAFGQYGIHGETFAGIVGPLEHDLYQTGWK